MPRGSCAVRDLARAPRTLHCTRPCACPEDLALCGILRMHLAQDSLHVRVMALTGTATWHRYALVENLRTPTRLPGTQWDSACVAVREAGSPAAVPRHFVGSGEDELGRLGGTRIQGRTRGQGRVRGSLHARAAHGGSPSLPLGELPDCSHAVQVVLPVQFAQACNYFTVGQLHPALLFMVSCLVWRNASTISCLT